MTALPKPVRKTTCSQDDEGEEETVEETQEEENTSSHNPGVAFWVGVKAPDSFLQALETKLMQLFSQCGFSIYSCKVSMITLI